MCKHSSTNANPVEEFIIFGLLGNMRLSSTGTFNNQRYGYHTAQLSDGRIVVIGGRKSYSNAPATLAFENTVEIYDPSTGVFKVTANQTNLNIYGGQTIVLPNGNVFLFGDYTANNNAVVSGFSYNSTVDNFTSTNNTISISNIGNSPGILLQNGKVLIPGDSADKSTALFDPSTNNFSVGASKQVSRTWPSSVLLQNGKVLVSGGLSGVNRVTSAELYDPVGNSFTSTTGSMLEAKDQHTSVLLKDGTVAIFGGSIGSSRISEILIYNPNSQQFSQIGSSTVISNLSTINLPDGRIFVGCDPYNMGFSSVGFIYNPNTGSVFVDQLANVQCTFGALLSTGRIFMLSDNGAYLYTPPSQ